MAELLQHGRNEEQDRIAEWMVVPSDSNLYLETVKTAEALQTETACSRIARMKRL